MPVDKNNFIIDPLTAMTGLKPKEGEISLGVGEPPRSLGINPAILKLLSSGKLAEIDTCYSSTAGNEETLDAVRKLYQNDYHVNFEAYLVANGSTESLREIGRLFGPQDAVLLPIPYYPGHIACFSHTQCVPIAPPKKNARMNFQGLQESLENNPNAKIIIFSQNPESPIFVEEE